MSIVDHVSVSIASPDGCRELASGGSGAVAARSCAKPVAHVAFRNRGLVLFFEGLKPTARVLVKAIYLFPALLVVKAIFWYLRSPVSDYISIAFVVLLLVAFSLLAILILLYPFVGPPSTRYGKARLALTPPDPGDTAGILRALGLARLQPVEGDALRALTEGGGDSGPLRIRGRIVGEEDLSDGEIVLRDGWVETSGAVARQCVGTTFAVVAEGQPPVVVDLDSAPWIAGSPSSGEAPPGLEPHAAEELEKWVLGRTGGSLSLDQLQAAPGSVLRVGDEVELVAHAWEARASQQGLAVRGRPFELPGARGPQTPYRQGHGEPVIVARSAPDAPLIIVRSKAG